MGRFNKYGGIPVVILLVLIIGYSTKKRAQLASEGRYTIGTTIGQDGKFIKYKFKVGDKEVTNENRKLTFSPLINGGRYYVKFLPSDLSISWIYWDRPVPDQVIEAPSDGWEVIP